MPVKIEGSKNIRDIFSIFYDGVISYHQFKDGELQLEVEIYYLAERVNPRFTKFNVFLEGIENIRFTTWPSDLKSEPQVLSQIHTIFAPALDILEGNIKDGYIEVVCNKASPEFEYCGGELHFTAEAAIVIDEAGKPYSIEELDVLCKGYWDDWANKHKA